MTTPAGLTAEELAAVFANSGTDLVLIGGQAVALWADEYSDNLKLDAPVLSKDIDFWGDRARLTKLARKLGTKADYPHHRVMTNLSGIIRVRVVDRLINIDVLHRVPGLEEVDPRRVTLPLNFGDHPILVLDPISLIASKLHNLRHFNQSGRNDLEQLKLTIQVAGFFIEDAFRSGVRVGLNYCKRVFEMALHASNQNTFKKHSIKMLDAIPIKAIDQLRQAQDLPSEDREKLGKFIDSQWARLQANGLVQ
jgi:hypothetical protein